MFSNLSALIINVESGAVKYGEYQTSTILVTNDPLTVPPPPRVRILNELKVTVR
jgi:hypothetical protein